MDKIFVTSLGMVGVGIVYWFFFGKKEKQVEAAGSVDILVEGGYSPKVIVVPIGKPIALNFLRQDPTSCLEELVIPDFKVRRSLKMNIPETINITPQKTGEYRFECGMNMYSGKIIVK